MQSEGWSLNRCNPLASFQPPNCISQTWTHIFAASSAHLAAMRVARSKAMRGGEERSDEQ